MLGTAFHRISPAMLVAVVLTTIGLSGCSAASTVISTPADEQTIVGDEAQVEGGNLSDLSCDQVGELASTFTEGMFLNIDFPTEDSLMCSWGAEAGAGYQGTDLDILIYVNWRDVHSDAQTTTAICAQQGDYNDALLSGLGGCGSGSLNNTSDSSVETFVPGLQVSLSSSCNGSVNCHPVLPDNFSDENAWRAVESVIQYARG